MVMRTEQCFSHYFCVNIYKLLNVIKKGVISILNWWSKNADFYKWEQVENGHWEIDFETCEIFLIS